MLVRNERDRLGSLLTSLQRLKALRAAEAQNVFKISPILLIDTVILLDANQELKLFAPFFPKYLCEG